MLKCLKFLIKKSRGRVRGETKSMPPPALSSLRVQRSNPITSPLAGEVDTKCRVRGNKNQAGRTFYRWAREERNVAFDNKAMDTPELPQSIKRHEAPKYDCCSIGRSMIEMLGVLAIIGVLSVSGIAGYSKAIEKYKLNKALDDYKMLVFGLVEYKSDVEKLKNTPGSVGLANFIAAVNLLPTDWKYVDSHQFNDPYGNFLRIAYSNTNAENEQSRILMDIYLGGWQSNDEGKSVSKNFSNDLCVALYKDLIFPLHSLIFRAGNYIPSGAMIPMYGDAYCSEGRRCLKDMTITDFYNACNRCPKNEDICTLTLGF